MKATLSILILFVVMAGFGLVGTAIAQPDPVTSENVTDAPKPETPTDVAPKDAGAPGASEGAPETPKPDPVSEAESNPAGMLFDLVSAVRSGQWRMAAALALSLLMFGWNWTRKNVSWFKERLAGDRAGAISVLVLALAGGLVTSLVADAPLDFKLVAAGLWTAAEAVGIFVLLKKIWKPAE
jgi:hypothetical protein